MAHIHTETTEPSFAFPVFPLMARLLAGLLLLPLTPCLAHATQHPPGVLPSSTTDPVSQGIVAAVIISVFALLAMEKAHRVLVVVSAVALLWAVTYLTPWHLISFEAAQQALDLNVLFLLAAMMAVVGVLKSTGVFNWAVARLMERTRGQPRLVMRLVIWFTGGLSALADNVTTVIFVTPMAMQMAGQLAVAPTVFLLPMVMAANIGGTATLIGDPPNIMIGSGANLSFTAFLINLTLPVMIMMLVLEWYSERHFDYRPGSPERRVAARKAATINNPALLRWSLVISSGIFIGFLTHGLTGMPAAVPALIGAAAVLIVQDVIYLRTHQPSEQERVHGLIEVIKNEIEWPTLSFFAFLFIVVGAAVQTGLITTVASGLSWMIHEGSAILGLAPLSTLLFASLLLLWVSGILSGLIDNIPYVAVAIPIVAQLTGQLQGDTTVLWWALALGACLGGNGTVIGASANVTVIGIAERHGTRITFRDFTRFGAVVTAMTLTVSSGFVALHVYLGARGAFIWSGATLAVLYVARTVARRREVELASR